MQCFVFQSTLSSLECEFTAVKSDLNQRELDLAERSSTIDQLQAQITAEQQKNTDLLAEVVRLENKMETNEKVLEVM